MGVEGGGGAGAGGGGAAEFRQALDHTFQQSRAERRGGYRHALETSYNSTIKSGEAGGK